MKINFTVYLTLVLFATACRNNKGSQEEKTIMLPVTQLISKDTVLEREYVGDINAFRNVEIRARVQGYLEKIFIDEGEEVKKGQPLFQINDEEYRAEQSKARANLNSIIADARAAELEVKRVALLVEKNVMSETELELAKAKHAAVQARIEEARSNLSNATIRLSHTFIKAPFDGTIDRIPFKIGSLIGEGSLLTTVSDVRYIYAYFNVSEKEYLDYVKKKLNDEAQDAPVQLTLADGSAYPHPGLIETMEGEFESRTGTIAFRARFPNPEKILKHGSSGRIHLTNTLKDALIVPQKATLEIQDRTYVYVVDENNTVTMKSFTPQSRFSHFYIVDQGLEDGEKIVYEGIQLVREGMQITPSYLSMDSVMNSAAGKFRTLSKL